MSEAEEKITTDVLEVKLAEKYPRDRYALFFNVPDAVGTNANRRADAIAIGCWRSVGHSIDGFELKVSRSDWLREVGQVRLADQRNERLPFHVVVRKWLWNKGFFHCVKRMNGFLVCVNYRSRARSRRRLRSHHRLRESEGRAGLPSMAVHISNEVFGWHQ